MTAALRIASWIVTGVAVTLVVAAVYFFTYRPDPGRYRIRGVDVSRHQGEIDWTEVAKNGVHFAYIKATEGGDWSDPLFAENWAEARKAGLATGAYHFFTLCRPGADQARNFLAALPREATMLPPVVDLEYVGNCARNPTKAELKAEVAAFLAAVEGELGRKAMLYVPVDFLSAYGSALPARPLWRRSIFREPHKNDWVLWQYHFAGRVSGVVGGVDLNVFNGGAPAFGEFHGVVTAER
jgi:lysozyme